MCASFPIFCRLKFVATEAEFNARTHTGGACLLSLRPVFSLSTKALKESFIKAIGTGLGFNLQRVEFHLSSELVTPGRVLHQTKMLLDEEEEEDWTFEVSPFEQKCNK